jgi:hypothetical protein
MLSLCLSTNSSRKHTGKVKAGIHVLLPLALEGDDKSASCILCKVFLISIGLKPSWSQNFANTHVYIFFSDFTRGVVQKETCVSGNNTVYPGDTDVTSSEPWVYTHTPTKNTIIWTEVSVKTIHPVSSLVALFLGTFAKCEKPPFASLCLSALNNVAPVGRIFMKFCIRGFFENVLRKIQFSLKSEK